MLVPLAAVLSIAMAPAAARAAPITFDTALPVRERGLVVREQGIWLRATDDPTPLDRELDVLTASTVLVYGAHSRLALMGALPFHRKELDVTTPSGRVSRSVSGFGDLRTVLRYTALAVDRRGETLRLAPYAGVELPTGADDASDDLGRLPRPLQLGSGAWNPLAGAILTWQTLRWQLDLSTGAELRTRAEGFDAGDEVRADASLQYRVLPSGRLGGGVPSFLFAVLETNAVWQGRDGVGSTRDPDSGGFTVHVAPGVQWVMVRAILEAAVQIPIAERRNGSGLGQDFVGRVGLRLNL